MQRNYKAEQELWSAVRLLAHRSDDIKKRLANAYRYHLCYVRHEDMPTNELKEKLINAKQKLTEDHTKSVEDTLYCWEMESCSTIADDICDLYYDFIHFEWHLYPEKNLLELPVEKREPSS